VTVKPATIEAFNAALAPEDQRICAALRAAIERDLPEAESRIWHAHPVWFLQGNPIVGYSKLKTCVGVLFWSGQSFEAPGLAPEGSFKAAEKRLTSHADIDEGLLVEWLKESREIQWDYTNIVKRKGELVRLK